MTVPCPPALLAFQRWITQIVRLPLKELDSLHLPVYENQVATEIEQKISPSAHLSATQALGIYNQQYWFRFFTLAQENFPTLVRLFGYMDFNQLIALPAILKYPPDHWAVWRATEHIPHWIEEEYSGEDKALILKLAQIDAAYHDHLYYDHVAIPKDEDLLNFREKLLEQEPEYWLTHPFPITEEGFLFCEEP